MEPVLAVWAGHYLDGTTLTAEQLKPYIQDALNELEYILGDASTTYGALRISHGHTKPWKVSYVEIGNEDNITDGEEYVFPPLYPIHIQLHKANMQSALTLPTAGSCSTTRSRLPTQTSPLWPPQSPSLFP